MANFDIMTEDGRRLFLGYDQDGMIARYDLGHDDAFLYFWCLSRLYRIERSTGYVQETEELLPLADFLGQRERSGADKAAFASPDRRWKRASNEIAMTFYDILCYGRENAAATGEFININSLVHMISAAGNPGGGLFRKYEQRFDEQSEKLEKALLRLGGRREGKGDIAYELPLFDFMNIRLALWHADEDFPASMESFVDTGILGFMHFETVWYMMMIFISRIEEEMNR